MPRVKPLSDAERIRRKFGEALGRARGLRGLENPDVAKLMPVSQGTFYNRLKNPSKFTLGEISVLSRNFPESFTDVLICQMIGVEYHGNTPI